MLEKYFPKDWIKALGEERLTEILLDIGSQLVVLRQDAKILPLEGDPLLFQAFRETPFSKIKVVVVGMDPYHDGSFNGLSFGNGSREDFMLLKISPSLRNILKEVERTELIKANPNLYSWAQQGVLMINTAHTVVQGLPGQHLDLWRPFTELVFKALNTKKDLIWMLWGKDAQAYESFVTNPTHQILKAGHPSPLNRSNPFIGCNCFADCNILLKSKGYDGILWN